MHKVNDVLYCMFGANEARVNGNYGEEREWLSRMYINMDQMFEEDINADLRKYKPVPLESEQLIGERVSQFLIDIDVSKVCDDHYDSNCMRGKCPKCSPTACKELTWAEAYKKMGITGRNK